MGTIYIATTGNATNSGSTDQDAHNLTGSAATVSGSVVTLDGSPNLSALVTSGATQSSIYIADATNANMKIFWISAFDDTANTVTVTVAPTGVASSVWKIGGRILHSATSVGTLEGAVRAGDIVQFNDSPATLATSIFTCRQSGSNTAGFAILRGKTGTRPVLTCSGSGVAPVTSNSQTGWRVTNLDLIQSNASSGVALSSGAGWLVDNCKLSAPGVVLSAGGATRAINCEMTTAAAGTSDGISTTSNGNIIIGCYIHDVTRDGIRHTGAGPFLTVINCIIDSCAAKGIYLSGASTSQAHNNLIMGNTIYGCGDSGIQVDDADTIVTMINNILQDNGNAAGESNVEWTAGTADLLGYHSHNILYDNTGADASTAFITLDSTEFTTDPLLNGPGSGDFSISSSSPGKGTGFPAAFPTATSTGYPDMGAVQRQETGAGGGGVAGKVFGG